MRILCVVLALAGLPAFAQTPPCGPHDDHLAELAQVFGETVHARALQATGNVLEITVNPATGSWTAVVTGPDGRSCNVAAGTHFTTTPPGDPA